MARPKKNLAVPATPAADKARLAGRRLQLKARLRQERSTVELITTAAARTAVAHERVIAHDKRSIAALDAAIAATQHRIDKYQAVVLKQGVLLREISEKRAARTRLVAAAARGEQASAKALSVSAERAGRALNKAEAAASKAEAALAAFDAAHPPPVKPARAAKPVTPAELEGPATPAGYLQEGARND